MSRDADLRDQLERAARNAFRAIAEGLGDALQDGIDRRYFSEDRVLPLQRLARRATKAIGRFIAYLRTSRPPNEG